MVQRDDEHTTTEQEVGRFRTAVRGYRFAARPPGADHPHTGQPILLHHERGHPMDASAVAIWTRSGHGIPWRIGYLERSVAARVAPRIRAGRRITGEVVGWMAEPDGRWRRPVIEVDRTDVDEPADVVEPDVLDAAGQPRTGTAARCDPG